MDKLNLELKQCEFMLLALEDQLQEIKTKFKGKKIRIQYADDDSDYEDGEIYAITLEDNTIKLHIEYDNGWYGYHNIDEKHRIIFLLDE